jgi:predicted polyphosphate/ATP-dependent NAD kinase
MPKLIVSVPAIHQEYDLEQIAKFFGEEDKARNRFVVDKRFVDAHPELVSDTAERDSKWAQENGIPEGTDWILFIGKDGTIRYVCRRGGRLDRRYDDALGGTFLGYFWVACPCK